MLEKRGEKNRNICKLLKEKGRREQYDSEHNSYSAVHSAFKRRGGGRRKNNEQDIKRKNREDLTRIELSLHRGRTEVNE